MKTIATEETIAYGKTLASGFTGGEVVALHGEMGAGKSTLTKGIAAGLGVKGEVVSPTFGLMNVYEGDKLTLVHIDTYRLEHEDELREIGVEDYLGQPGVVTVIEWPEKVAGLLAGKAVMNITLAHDDDGRTISV